MEEASKSAPLSSILCGVAGEYFVAAELSRRGYIASITLRNTRGVDILASNEEATRSVGIQVKTSQRGRAEWVLNRKAEVEGAAENLFYVFVILNGLEAPAYYVVPRNDVARFVRESHARWLSTPGREGQAHADTAVRKFEDPTGQYRNRWDRLGLDAAAVNVR